jgi:demethylmenaquinone methyltransferase/2-methoxy-6-polyprenyl-1,4-benzoquinol methylase
MIDARRVSSQKIARVYDLRSRMYDFTVARSEFGYHLKALKRVRWQPDMRILEVAPGPGRVMAKLAEEVDGATKLYGLDVSSKMLGLTRKRLNRRGFTQYELQQGDCRRLPWPDNSFDLLYNGYMMDLIPNAEMGGVLAEFHRVLKPGGQLVLLNMSARDGSVGLWERLYLILPDLMVHHLMGNCRPVRMERYVVEASFTEVNREYLGGRHPSEIVSAIKEME